MLRLDLNLVWTMINLLIIYFVVRKFLFKPVNKILAARQEEIDKQYEDAQKAQDTAESMKQQYEESLKGLSDEKAEILSEARNKAGEEYAQIVEEAKSEADKIKSDAKRAADMEQEKYVRETREKIADLVVAATAKIVASKQDEESDRELFNQFLAKTGENSD